MTPCTHSRILQPAALIITAACLFSTGCAAERVNLREGAREYVPTDYESVLRTWTRTEQLITTNEMDNVLTVSATYQSWDFRWAYTVRYAEDYRLTVDQRRVALERSLTKGRQEHRFYVALYAQRHRWNDLNAENPAWIVRLVDDQGGETAPSEIEPIKRPGAVELTYFPYTTPWRSAYWIRFPVRRADGRPAISKNSQWFGLRFAGAQGNQELVWEVGGSGS